MSGRISRRRFLASSAAVGAAVGARVFAEPRWVARGEDGAPPSLVAIYLRGGADFLNLLIPYADPAYAVMRPGIGIREEDGWIELDKRWALHPALAPLEPMYRAKHLAPIVCVGSPHPTRSHFDAQDFMEFAAPGDRTVRTGWLNRYLQATAREGSGSFRGVALQSLLPRSLRGSYPVLAVPAEVDGKRSLEALDRFDELYGGGKGPRSREEGTVEASGRITIETLRRFREIASGGSPDAYGYPASAFGRGLFRIGQVLTAGVGLEVAGLDYNGWDHHAGEGGAAGTHARMCRDLAQGLAAFDRQLGEGRDRVVVLVMTEFGRTAAENGSGGTDHGHGGGMLLIGGGVKGGQVHGDWRGLELADLYEGRDLPVTTDFRDVFAAALRQVFEFKGAKELFPGHEVRSVKLF